MEFVCLIEFLFTDSKNKKENKYIYKYNRHNYIRDKLIEMCLWMILFDTKATKSIPPSSVERN